MCFEFLIQDILIMYVDYLPRPFKNIKIYSFFASKIFTNKNKATSGGDFQSVFPDQVCFLSSKCFHVVWVDIYVVIDLQSERRTLDFLKEYLADLIALVILKWHDCPQNVLCNHHSQFGLNQRWTKCCDRDGRRIKSLLSQNCVLQNVFWVYYPRCIDHVYETYLPRPFKKIEIQSFFSSKILTNKNKATSVGDFQSVFPDHACFLSSKCFHSVCVNIYFVV